MHTSACSSTGEVAAILLLCDDVPKKETPEMRNPTFHQVCAFAFLQLHALQQLIVVFPLLLRLHVITHRRTWLELLGSLSNLQCMKTT